jgi:hypothetical protein
VQTAQGQLPLRKHGKVLANQRIKSQERESAVVIEKRSSSKS